MRTLRFTTALAPILFAFSAHAQNGQCERDGDCEATEECLLDDVDVAECPPGEECEPVEVEPQGWCYPRPVTCSRDADCPEPTRCDDDGECVYTFQLCDSDAMCDARYACTDLGGGRECVSAGEAGGGDSGGESDSGGSEASGPGSKGTDPAMSDPKVAPDPLPDEGGDPLPDDSETPPDVQQPPEAEQCEPREPELICFPEVEPCSDDSDCAGDWTCEEIPDGGPDSWGGVAKACLPPGLVAVLDGRIQPDDSGADDESTSGEGQQPGDEEPVIDDDDERVEPSDAIGLGTQGGSEGSSGCALGGRGGTSPSPWLLLLLGLVGLRRRS